MKKKTDLFYLQSAAHAGWKTTAWKQREEVRHVKAMIETRRWLAEQKLKEEPSAP